MIYVSQLQGKPVYDAWGGSVGRCVDVLVDHPERPFPTVCALAVRDGADLFIPAAQVSSLYPGIVMGVRRAELTPYTPHGGELWLGRHVLDRQIMDTEGRRVVRVNDLQLAQMRGRWCLTGVDVGGLGLLRRLGVEGAARRVAGWLRRPLPEGVIPWEDVAPLQEEGPVRLQIAKDKIAKLHPADIAAILQDLDPHTGQELIASLPDEALAEALQEVPSEVQVAVLSDLEPERAADVLQEMEPDEAADLVADLPPETGEDLLDLMELAEAKDVRALLAYPADSAGGIMTTEFASVPAGLTVGRALEYLRKSEQAQESELLYYVYILREGGKLEGVVRLRHLVLAPWDAPLADYAEMGKLVAVSPQTPQTEVAYLVAKYDLLAVPVVDEAGVLLGIVTVDDAVDAVLPTAWKKRIPRFVERG